MICFLRGKKFSSQQRPRKKFSDWLIGPNVADIACKNFSYWLTNVADIARKNFSDWLINVGEILVVKKPWLANGSALLVDC